MALNKREIGQEGEALAESYLSGQGYEILERNFVSKLGEIDLVALRKDRLYFVEVKRRHGAEYGPAIDAVSAKKKNRIRKTAQYYLLKNENRRRLIPFFSVLTIDETDGQDPRIEFIPDAFF